MRRNQGFTLLELLVAIGIFAIMSVMAYGGMTQILETHDYVQKEKNYQRRLVMAFMRLEDDLAETRNRPVRDIDGTLLPAFIGKPTDIRALGDASIEFTRGGIPIIPRLNINEGESTDGQPPRSDLQRIGYRLTDEGVLMRMTWRVLDRAPSTEVDESPLLEQVEEFQLRFYERNQGWTDNWPPIQRVFEQQQTDKTPDNDLPAGVEIKLKLIDSPEITRLFLTGS